MPIEVVTRNKNDKPWITQNLQEIVRKRQCAHHKSHRALFKFYRARVRNSAKYWRKRYYRSEVAHLKASNPRRWWKHTKQLGERILTSLKALANNTCDRHCKRLADKINIAFQSVTKDLPPLELSILPPLTNYVPDKYIISVETVEKKLSQITTFKAPGPDAIPNWILHDLSSIISQPILPYLTAP